MESFQEMSLVFTAGIFFTAFLALLLAGFNALLNAKIEPIKKDMARLEGRMDKLETDVQSLKAGQAELKELILKQKA